MRVRQALIALSLPLTLVSCSSSSPERASKSEWVLGRVDDVRVQAEILADSVSSNTVRVRCEVENLRSEPIQIATVNAESSFDPSSATVTVNVGSEVPVADESQLVTIRPNEKRSFAVATSVAPSRGSAGVGGPPRRLVRVQLHFLQRPLAALARAIDPFDDWLDAKRTVVTNAIPIQGNPFPLGTEATSTRRGFGGYLGY